MDVKSQIPKVVLVNDTSLFNSHFGCQLVGQTFREQFSRVGLQLIGSFGLRFDLSAARQVLACADLVVINGEGSIHHNRNLHLIEIATHFPCALVNCVWEENSECRSVSSLKYIAAREPYSRQELGKAGISCEIVPDVIFASKMLNSFVIEKTDLEIGITDNVTNPDIGFGPHVTLVSDYLSQLGRYERLCIGRFHAAIAACVLRIPFSTWDSNTWKTKAMMQEMGLGHLHFQSFEEAIANIPTELDHRAIEYAARAIVRVEEMFDTLARIAGSSVEH